MHVLDTDVCVDVLRGRASTVDRLETLESRGLLAVSAVTAHELWQGAFGARVPDEAASAVGRLLATLEVLPYDDETAREGGRLTATLHASGSSIGDLDTMIAATALARGAIVVTRNVRHYRRVPGLQVLGA